MTAADPSVQKLSEMADCAYRLGMRFGAEAERERDLAKALDWVKLFDRCFFSVRVSIALQLRLRHAPGAPRPAASDREALIEPEDLADPAEPDGAERPERYDERDRDREVERASFPILVRALEGVVADAQALPGPEPADLPTLRELLAHVKAAPAAVAVAPRPAATLRSRLAGSGAAATTPPPPHRASNVGDVLAARRATGPPRR